MTPPSQPKQGQGRRRRGKKPKAVDLWRPVPALDPPEPIVRASDPSIVVRSLGTPPLKGQGAEAERQLILAVDKAAGTAIALASTIGLQAEPPTDDA